MNICVTVSSKYERYLYVMLTSLYKQHNCGDIHLFVINRDFTESDKSDISALTKLYGNKVDYVHADPHKFNTLPKSREGRDDLSLEIYFRLLIPEYLAEDVERVLMLDVDLVIINNLMDLYSIDFGDNYLAAAPNMCHNMYVPEGWRTWYPQTRTNWKHYNTGVLMWNLKKIREDLPREYIFNQAFAQKINIATYEEELFNVLFGEDRVYELRADKFNYICTHENNFEQPNFKIYPTNDKLLENCSIVHFAALHPWQSGIKNEKFVLWWDVCKKTKYYHEILEECYVAAETYLSMYADCENSKWIEEINVLKRQIDLDEKKLSYIDRLFNTEAAARIKNNLSALSANKIAIYGAGRIALCLSVLLKEIGVEISFYIDKAYQGIFSGKPVIPPNQLRDHESDFGCIIISNSYHTEIMKMVKWETDKLVITIDELINNNYGSFKNAMD